MRFLWYPESLEVRGLSASADNPYWLPLSILDIIKTEGNDCFTDTLNEFFLSRFDIKCTFSKFVPTLSFPQVLSVFSLSRNQLTAPCPPSSTSLCFVSPCLQLFFRWLAPGWLARSKQTCRKSCFCFFTDGQQHKTRELDRITLRNRAPRSYMTTVDLECPWHDYCIICS